MADRFRRLHLLVEGQTEEAIVREVLEPWLRDRGFSVSLSMLVTQRPVGQPWRRGRVSSWTRIAGNGGPSEGLCA